MNVTSATNAFLHAIYARSDESDTVEEPKFDGISHKSRDLVDTKNVIPSKSMETSITPHIRKADNVVSTI